MPKLVTSGIIECFFVESKELNKVMCFEIDYNRKDFGPQKLVPAMVMIHLTDEQRREIEDLQKADKNNSKPLDIIRKAITDKVFFEIIEDHYSKYIHKTNHLNKEMNSLWLEQYIKSAAGRRLHDSLLE